MNFWKGSADVVRNDGQSCKHFLHDVDDNQNYVGKYEDKSPFKKKQLHQPTSNQV